MSDKDLPKYTLSHDDKKDDWVLKKDGSDRATKRFDTKADATKGAFSPTHSGKSAALSKSRRLTANIRKSGPTHAPKIRVVRRDKHEHLSRLLNQDIVGMQAQHSLCGWLSMAGLPACSA